MDKDPIESKHLDEEVQSAMERDRARMPSFAEKPNDRLLGILAGATATKSIWSLFGTKLALLATGAAVVATTWYFASAPKESPSPLPAAREHQTVVTTKNTDELPSDTLRTKIVEQNHKTSLPASHTAIAPQSPMRLDDSDRNDIRIYTDPSLHPNKHR